nr:MAG TPA: protein of unknown function (DUF5506) [Caudoviricetes sp.]
MGGFLAGQPFSSCDCHVTTSCFIVYRCISSLVDRITTFLD